MLTLLLFPESSEVFFVPHEWMPDIHLLKDINNIANFTIPEIEWNGQKICFLKTHESELPRQQKENINTLGFIYLYRHPLDVLLSSINLCYLKKRNKFFHDHQVHSVDELKQSGQIKNYVERFSKTDLKIGPWSGFAGTYKENVSYWLNLREKNIYPVSLIFKYEDLVTDTFTQLQRLREYFSIEEEQMNKVIELAQDYTQDGGRFYWKKRTDNYQEYLEDEIIINFTNTNQIFLEKIGYS
jgi:hypothetical protein